MSSKSAYSLETVFNLIDRATSPLKNIERQSGMVNNALKTTFVNAQAYSDRFARRLKSLGTGLLKISGIAALLNFNLIKNFITTDIRNAMNLADTMARIGNNANITGKPLERLRNDLIRVGNNAGFAVTELAKIANSAVSAGIAADAAADFSAIVARTARVSGDSADHIVNVLTTVVNAYGKTAEQTKIFSDQMIIANRIGNTSYSQMAKGMRYVIPAAAALGVQTQDVFASIATLTSHGIDTRDSMRSIGDAMNAISRPSREASELAQKLGINFSEAALQSKGFAGFMEKLQEKTGGNARALEILFGNARTARSISVLTSTGSQAFADALYEMSNATGALDEQFARVTDTPAERWQRAVNQIRNTGLGLGTALLPMVERITARVSELAERVTAINFDQYSGVFEKVFNRIDAFIDFIFGAVKTLWQFRGAIITVVGAVAAYRAAQLALVATVKVFTTTQKIKNATTIMATALFKGQTAALAKLEAGTKAHTIVTKAFTIAEKIRNGIMSLATKGMLTQKAATAAMVVATGKATIAQKALNLVMKANPIGLVVTAVGALIVGLVALARNWRRVSDAVRNNAERVLFVVSIFTGPFGLIISMVQELFNNWENVKKAFRDGGILAAIKRIGNTLLSGLLAPAQRLLEILSRIPGLEHLAGQGRDRLQELRDNLRGIDRTEVETQATKKIEEMTSAPEAVTRSAQALNTPDLSFLDNWDNRNERSRIRGVVDVSGGSPFIPNRVIGGSGAAMASTPPRQPAISVQEAIKTASAGVTSVLREILTATNRAAAALEAPVVLNYPMPSLPQRQIDAGRAERERADADNPRNIAPITSGERAAYSLRETRETLGIEVMAAQGTEARIVKAPRSPNIQVIHSGSNV